MSAIVPVQLSSALADRYRIERELGAGAIATVYLAHDVKHDRGGRHGTSAQSYDVRAPTLSLGAPAHFGVSLDGGRQTSGCQAAVWAF